MTAGRLKIWNELAGAWEYPPGAPAGGSSPVVPMRPQSTDGTRSSAIFPFTYDVPDYVDPSVWTGLQAGYSHPAPVLRLGIIPNEWYFAPDSDWMIPFFAPVPFSFDAFGIACRNGETGKHVRAALYNADKYGQPTTLVKQSGAIPLPNTNLEAFVEDTPFAPVTCPAGPYLLAVNSDCTAETAYPSQVIIPFIGWPAAGDDGDGEVQRIGQIVHARSFGAFPSSGLSWADADVVLSAASVNLNGATFPGGITVNNGVWLRVFTP